MWAGTSYFTLSYSFFCKKIYMLFLLQTFSCFLSLSEVSDTQESAIGLKKCLVFQELLFKFYWDGFKETTNQHIIFSSFVYFRKIWLLAKTTHILRINAKAAITIITLRTHGNSWGSCNREEEECLNFEFRNSLSLLEDIRRRQSWKHGSPRKVTHHALLSSGFVDIQYSTVCKQDGVSQQTWMKQMVFLGKNLHHFLTSGDLKD